MLWVWRDGRSTCQRAAPALGQPGPDAMPRLCGALVWGHVGWSSRAMQGMDAVQLVNVDKTLTQVPPDRAAGSLQGSPL